MSPRSTLKNPIRHCRKEFEKLADFRYKLRRCSHFSEEITRRLGVTPLQYLLLLNIKGFSGRISRRLNPEPAQ